MKYAALGFVLAATVALGAPGDLIILRPDPINTDEMRPRPTRHPLYLPGPIIDTETDGVDFYVDSRGVMHDIRQGTGECRVRATYCGGCHFTQSRAPKVATKKAAKVEAR